MNNMPLTSSELKKFTRYDFNNIDPNALDIKLKNGIDCTEHECDYLEWLGYLQEQAKQISVEELKIKLKRKYDVIMKTNNKNGDPESPPPP